MILLVRINKRETRANGESGTLFKFLWFAEFLGPDRAPAAITAIIVERPYFRFAKMLLLRRIQATTFANVDCPDVGGIAEMTTLGRDFATGFTFKCCHLISSFYLAAKLILE